MKIISKSRLLIVVGLLFSLGIGAAYGAADFPRKSITITCHTGAGAGMDVLARAIVAINDKYKLLPQPMSVENKPGGSGAVAMGYVAGKIKDPYNLITVVAGPFIQTPVVEGLSVTYRDFTPIVGLLYEEVALVVNANSKFKTLRDLVDAAKASPDTIVAGGPNKSSQLFFCFYDLEKAAGVKMKYVTFAGGGQALIATLGGHVDFSLQQPSEVSELRKGGKVRVLGIFSEQRIPGLPDVPTVKEQGFNVVAPPTMRGFAAPKDIPADARKILEEAFIKATKTTEYKKFVSDMFSVENIMDGEKFAKWLAAEEVRFQNDLDRTGFPYKKK
jgi:putative tricarboxylic transport membrane protein